MKSIMSVWKESITSVWKESITLIWKESITLVWKESICLLNETAHDAGAAHQFSLFAFSDRRM
jgi:hypothetical protein